MRTRLSLVLLLSNFAYCPIQAQQESREVYLAGLRAAVKNPADNHDIYRRVIQPEFRTFLLDAAKKSDLALAGELLSAYFGSNRSHDPALSLAVAFGDMEIFKALLEHGADVNASNEQQWTPLHSAANDDQRPEMLQMLLDKGADPNARSFVGTTPLMQAAEINAVKNVVALISAGAKINVRNNDGETALILAVKNNHAVTVKFLLESGANPRLKDDKGKIAAEYISANQRQPLYPGRDPGGEFTEQRTKEFEQEQRANSKQITALLENAKYPAILSLAVSSDGKVLASSDANGEVQIWNTQTGRQTDTLIVNERTTAWALSPDGKQFAVGCGQHGIQIWTKQNNGFRQTRLLPFSLVTALAFFPDGKVLAAGRERNGTIVLFDMKSGAVRGSIATKYIVSLLAFSPKGKRLLSGGVDAKLWDVSANSPAWRDNEPKLVSDDPVAPQKALLWQTNRGRVIYAAFASNGVVAMDFYDPKSRSTGVQIWDSERGKLKRTLNLSAGYMTFVPDSQTLAIGNIEGYVTLWNIETGKETFRTRLTSSVIHALAPIPNTSLLAVGCGDGSLLLWDAAAKTVRQSLIKSSGSAGYFSDFSP